MASPGGGGGGGGGEGSETMSRPLGRLEGTLLRLLRNMQSVVLFQPSVLVDEQDKTAQALRKKKNRRMDASEGEYIQRHSSVLRQSAVEQVVALVATVTNFVFNLPAVLQLLAMVCMFVMLLVMLPAILGVIMTVVDSRVELIRLVTLIGMLVASMLALTIIRV
jgi:hypothetical protein